MPSQHDFERQINQVLNELSKIQGIDPSAFNQVKKDVDALQRNISMNAKEFKSTTRDIKDLRKAMMNAASIMDDQAKKFHANAAQSINLKTFADKLRMMQDSLAKYARLNVDALKDNDNALKAQAKAIRLATRQRQHLDMMRQREEERYIKRLKELNSRRDMFRARITGNLGQFSRSEVRQHDRFMIVAENNRRSLSQRRSAGIAANVVDDIPSKVLSKIRVRAMSAPDATDKNLFEQFQDLKRFQTAGRVRETKDDLLNVSRARATNSPLLKIYRAMDAEAKSPKSRLIIVNLFKNAFLRPIKVALKTVGAVFKNLFIGLLNAPFKILGKIGSSFANVFGDTFTRITKGKEAVNAKVDNRNLRQQEASIDREEAFNDSLGIGVDRLANVIEEYLGLISRAGIQQTSNQYSLNEISKLDKEIKQVRTERNRRNKAQPNAGTNTNANPGMAGVGSTDTQNMTISSPMGQFQIENATITVAKVEEPAAAEPEVEVTPAETSKSKNVMSRAHEIAKEVAAKFGGSSKDFFSEALKMAHAEKRGETAMPQSQEVEQKAEQEMEVQEQQNELLEDIRNAVTEEGDQKGEGKGGGIFGAIKGLFKGGIFKNLFNALKGFGPKLLSSLGLSSGGGLLAVGKGVLGAAARVAPWAAAVYTVAKAFHETSEEFVDQGNAIDNGLERFRLLSQNLVTAMPGLVDSVAAMVGIETNFKGFVDGIFEQLNRLGSFIGDKTYDLFEFVKARLTGGETFKEMRERQIREIEMKQQTKKEVEEYFENARKESAERDAKIDELLAPSPPVEYKPKDTKRNPFAPPSSDVEVSPAASASPDMSSLPIRVTSADTGKHRKGSKHGQGMAIDLTPPGYGGMAYSGTPLADENPEAFAAYERTADLLRGMGLKVVDEYSAGGKTSQFGSARHIHVEGSKEQIQDLINRAEIVKPGAVSAATNLKDMKTREMLASSRAKLNNNMRKAQTEKKEMPGGTPVSINVPAPKVIMDKDLDGSFNGWMAIQQMHA